MFASSLRHAGWVAGLVCLAAVGYTPSPAPAQAERAGPAGGAAMRQPAGTPQELLLGGRIYQEGVGLDGRAIVGTRLGGIAASGAAVACVACHRRSGLGSVEGTDKIAPIAGRFIFSGDPNAVVAMNYRNGSGLSRTGAPHTDASLAGAMRDGVDRGGRELSAVMPRFDLREAELRGLAAYLRSLSAAWSPGVTATRIRLASVITPEVGADKRALFVRTLRAIVARKNDLAASQRPMASTRLRTERLWELELWELHGPAPTWAAQLDERQRADPVFALVSGLGEGDWAPVHSFCERAAVPCWFPIVAVPPQQAEQDFYSLYFSAGVATEARVLAQHLAAQAPPPARLVQLHAGDAAGRAAAQALREALAGLAPDIALVEHALPAGDTAALRRALAAEVAQVNADAVWMLWLPPDPLARLPETVPPGVAVFASGQLADAPAAPLPAAWRQRIRWVYPYALPHERDAVRYFLKARLDAVQLPLSDEIVQSQVFFALSYFAETLAEMLDNLHRDYLIERAESMLGQRESATAKAEDESRAHILARLQNRGAGAPGAAARQALAAMQGSVPLAARRTEGALPLREATTVYPRLALAQGQRFASKGAYIVRRVDESSHPRAGATGPALVAETDWIVP
jgi:hypothetical protein